MWDTLYDEYLWYWKKHVYIIFMLAFTLSFSKDLDFQIATEKDKIR